MEDADTPLAEADQEEAGETVEIVEHDLSLSLINENLDEHYCTLLCSPFMRRMLSLIGLYLTSRYIPAVFMATYGAEWFAGCTDSSSDDNCDPDYTSYQLYNSLFLSIEGLISFLFAGYIGRASDAFGRKYVIFFGVFISMLPFLIMFLFENLWIYFIFVVISGLKGCTDGVTPVMLASISDKVQNNKQKAIAFGFTHAMNGIALFFGIFFLF